MIVDGSIEAVMLRRDQGSATKATVGNLSQNGKPHTVPNVFLVQAFRPSMLDTFRSLFTPTVYTTNKSAE